MEPPANLVEFFQIDAAHSQRSLDRLHDGSNVELDMRLHFEILHHPFRNGSSAQGSGKGSAFGTHPYVCADSTRPLLGIFDQAVGQTHQREDQCDRHRDQQRAEKRAHGPVLQVFKYDFSYHLSTFQEIPMEWLAWPARLARRAAACFLAVASA